MKTIKNKHNTKQKEYYHSANQPTIQAVNSNYVYQHIDNLLRFAKLSKANKTLEVGAGVGRFSKIMKAKNINLTASDLSPELIEKLQLNSPDIPCFVGDINELPSEQFASYDSVIGFFVLHHLNDLSLSFKSLSKVLKPSGQIVFCEPNAWFFPFYLQILLTPRMKWSIDKGVRNMRQKLFNEVLKANGFIDIEYKYYGFFPPLIYNTSWGQKLDHWLCRNLLPEKMKAFVMIKAKLK